jgi:DNA-binding PadR family transcriptional regulator
MPMTRSPLTTEYALLGFLYQRPMYGYEIHQMLTSSTGLGLVWRLKQSRVYSMLTKLEEGGFVNTTLTPHPVGNRPPRKMFALTDLGREAFSNWVQSPVPRGRRLRLDFLAKLYFSQQVSLETTQQLIERQQLACTDWLAEQQQQKDDLPPNNSFDRLVHEFRISQTRAMLEWLNTCWKALPESQKETDHVE